MNNTQQRTEHVTAVPAASRRQMITLLADITGDARSIWRTRRHLRENPDALACYLTVIASYDTHRPSLIERFERDHVGSYGSHQAAASALVGNFTWADRLHQKAKQAGVDLMDSHPPVAQMAWDYLQLACRVVESDGRYHVFLPTERIR